MAAKFVPYPQQSHPTGELRAPPPRPDIIARMPKYVPECPMPSPKPIAQKCLSVKWACRPNYEDDRSPDREEAEPEPDELGVMPNIPAAFTNYCRPLQLPY